MTSGQLHVGTNTDQKQECKTTGETSPVSDSCNEPPGPQEVRCYFSSNGQRDAVIGKLEERIGMLESENEMK